MLCQKQVLLFNISLNCMIVIIKRCLWCENVGSFCLIFFPQDNHVETCGPYYIKNKIIKQFRETSFCLHCHRWLE